MAKPAVTRKKTVMQDVHPDIEARIEDFTDPEKIAKARERIIDYAKVAEQFAGTADLPDDDFNDDDVDLGVVAAPQAAPIIPVAVPVSQSDIDDLDLLNSIEDTPQADSPITTQRLDAEDDDQDDNLSFEDDLDSIFAKMKDENSSQGVDTSRSFEDDMGDFDTDLLNDDSGDDVQNNHNLGQDAYAPTSEDEEDDIFGIPAAVQTPPYGDKSAEAEDEGDDIFGIPSIPSVNQKPTPFGDVPADDEDDDLEAMLNARGTQNTGRKSPAWLEDDEDEEIPDIMPIGHAADTDSHEQDIFETMIGTDNDARKVSGTTDTHPAITSSPAALNDLMNLDKDDDQPVDVASTDTDSVLVAVPVSDKVSEVKPKKGFLSMFGKKNKAKTVTTVEDTDSGMVEETVIEKTEIETETGEVVIEETETVSVKQKRNPAKIAAIFAIMVGVAAAGGYAFTTMTGGTTPVPVEVVDDERRFPAIDTDTAPTVEDIQGVETPDVAPVETPDVDVLPAEPADVVIVPTETDDTLNMPDVAEDTDVVVDETITAPVETMDSDVETTVDEPVITDPLVDAPVDADPAVDAEAAEDGSIETDISTDAEPADAFEDLYGSGVSETEITQEQTQAAMAQMGKLSTLLTEQKSSLDAALNRVQTLEAIMAERDAALASAQSESELARQAAQEAKDMAMAQNKILIEVVGIRDKMQIAEELIVDLSQRTALIESDDSQAGEIRQLNERIGEMSRDIGLLARTVLTSGQNLADQQAAQAAADRAYENAQSAVDAQTEATLDRQTTAAPEGSGAVYDNERRLMTVPEAGEIPSDVEVGDVLEGFGEVLDITQMEDGSRLVVMENDSKILPRE